MGVLEDAIREHLELKRQHGASEEEVVRQETEVLGQARRQAAPAEGEDAEGQAEPVTDEELAVEEPLDEGAEPPVESPYADEQDLEPGLEPAPGGPVTEESPAVDPFETEPRSVADVFAADPPAEDEPPPPRDETVILDDPVEFDELEPGSAPPMPAHEDREEPEASAEGDEDVLEETPEFLQETPEHDRLWFEQKPPRDFDFD
jgi:hypothetical protein